MACAYQVRISIKGNDAQCQVTVHRCFLGTVWIRIADRDTFIEIAIVDDGVGMDEETRRHLLEPHPVRRRGIGLLNTERRLKQLYGRGLHIASQPNLGTTVTFRVYN